MSYVRSIVRYGQGLADKFRGTVMHGLAQAASEAVSQLEDRVIDLRRLEAAIPGMISDHEHAASAITSGTIDTARLGSGTADATSFLRGDQTWAYSGIGLVKTSDQSITSAGHVDVSGLTFAVTSGAWYAFEAFVMYMTSVTTMGVEISVNGPSATTFYSRQSKQTNSSASADMFTDRIVGAYDTSVIDPATSEVAADPSVLLYMITGAILPSASGTVAIRMDKENVAGTATVKAGSWLRYRRLA